MAVRIVQSKQNARLKELRRALARPGSGEFLAVEGPNLIAEALRAGLRLHCLFAAQGSERLLHALSIPPECEVLLLPKPLLNATLTTETPQPVAALIETPHWTWADLLKHARTQPPLLMVLAGLQDPGNLGAILRSAEAFGATGVLSLPGTVSAWNPKAVRASAGSFFRVPLLAVSADECFTRLRQAGVRLWSTAARGAKSAGLANLAGPAALLIGNEGNGVPSELASRAAGALTIPCPGPVESLNAAVAASILLYEASRQRATQAGDPSSPRGARR
jgi:TrmH family RNA methyltransferase